MGVPFCKQWSRRLWDARPSVPPYLRRGPRNPSRSRAGGDARLVPLAASKQHCHDLGDGIWEFVQGVARLFWSYDDEDGSLIICTHGLWKKTQKTPKAELERVTSRHRQYLESKRAGTLTRDWEEER